jgi:hypothetical protein
MSDHDFWTHDNFARSPQSQNSTHDAKSSDGIDDDDDDKKEECFSSKYRDGTTGRPYLKEVLVEVVMSSVVVVVLSVGDVIFRSKGRVGGDTE